MNAQIQAVRSGSAPLYQSRLVRPTRPGRAYAVALPSSPLLARSLPYVDWSDAFAVLVPHGPQRHPQEWADAIFHSPPIWIRALFGVRDLLVPLVGIEPGGSHVFETVSWNTKEVLIGTDEEHLRFRASVLLEPGRVVVSTVVEIRNLRGLAYSALVRRIHPFVVRSMLARAARKMAAAA